MESMTEIGSSSKEWKYFLRQFMACSAVWATLIMVGMFLGTPTVLVPQLRREFPDLDDDMASWLYSVVGFAALPWTFVLSILTHFYGLRIPQLTCCIALLVAYIMLYLSTSPLQILVSQILFGVGYSSIFTIGIVIISDYSSPKYRGIFLTTKSTSMFWGIWFANAIGTFFHWRNIAYTGFFCSAYSFIFVFCPESPQWLARNGRFDECRKAYFWLQGRNDRTAKEVEELIASQAKAGRTAKLDKPWNSLSNVIRTIKSQEFYGPLLLTTLLVAQYHLAGKFVCVIYVVDILKKMTDSESMAYKGMLILDGVTLISMYFGSFLSKIVNRRTLYLVSTFIGVAFLFIISLYSYLVQLTIIRENVIISLILLTGYSIAMGCGIMIINMSMYAELIPLKFKSVMFLIAALFLYGGLSIILKVAPYIFKTLGLHGAFLFYGITAGVCTVLLYKYLPETKDKTLQEIEKYFKPCNKEDYETERLNVKC